METIKLKPSTNKNKKWMLKIQGRTIHFGQRGATDFTLGANKATRDLYIKRHRKRENWNDPTSAGFWAKHLLWNRPSLDKSISYVNRAFGKVYNFKIVK